MAEWEKREPGWLYSPEIGSIRSAGYRPGGWWFLPQWLPDIVEYDVGPFQTRAEAIAAAEKMVLERL